jgi:hypothetical protein
MFLLFTFSCCFLFSCQKENAQEELTLIPDDLKSKYFFDGQPISKAVFDERDSSIPFAVVGKYQSDAQDTIITEFHAFSNKEKFLNFGDSRGYCYSAIDAFAKEVSTFAATRGIIDEYERSGFIPEYYYEFEKEKYNELVGKCRYSSIESRLFVVLRDFCANEGTTAVMPTTLPFMPSLNNRVSAVEFFGFIGTMTAWDRSFFRDRLFSINGFGIEVFCIIPQLDNRMSSGITVSL